MARLKTLAPAVRPLRPLLSASPDLMSSMQRRTAASPWRKWYGTKRWQDLRLSVLIRDQFTCRMCGKQSFQPAAMHCDHVEPHRGVEELFWNESNLQTLCASPCHNKHKKYLERLQ